MRVGEAIWPGLVFEIFLRMQIYVNNSELSSKEVFLSIPIEISFALLLKHMKIDDKPLSKFSITPVNKF